MQNKTTYSPTDAVLNNIQRGIALKSKYSRDTVTAKVNLQKIEKAKEMFDSGFTLDTIKKMYSELEPLEKSINFKNRAVDSGPTEEVIKYYAFGGSAGLAWSRMILKQAGILKSYTKDITEDETKKESDDPIGKIAVVKATNDELMQATFVVMVPDEVDLHGDITSESEVRKACHNFNKFCRKANLFHMVETDTFDVVESYVAPVEMVIGERIVKAGTWLTTLQVHDDTLWSLIKSGDICSVSIGALAKVEELDE